MKIFFNKLLKNGLILSLPGLLSILISLISIPIHLKIAGVDNYANFIIFHFLLTFTNLLNLGIGKSMVISINNFPKQNKQICFQGLRYTFYIFLSLLSIKFIYYFFFVKNSFELIILNIDFIYLISGAIVTLWFLTLEGIFQGNEKFNFLSFYNFLFYSLSLSLPSILLIFKEFSFQDLIYITLLIKFFSITIMVIHIFYQKLLIKSHTSILIKNLKKNSKWISMNLILIQFYDIFDKYIIKFFLGPVALATYSIPQQLTGKLSILSKGLSAFLLPKLSKNRTHNKDFNLSIEIFFKYISLIIFIIFPFYKKFLLFWLGNHFNENIILLTKIFSLSVIFSCLSHILITEFEAKKKLNNNIKIEIFILPFFLFLLIFLVSKNYSLLIISLLILVKEWILLLIRLYILRKTIFNFKVYFIFTIIFMMMLYLSIMNNLLFYICLICLSIFVLKSKHD